MTRFTKKISELFTGKNEVGDENGLNVAWISVSCKGEEWKKKIKKFMLYCITDIILLTSLLAELTAWRKGRVKNNSIMADQLSVSTNI